MKKPTDKDRVTIIGATGSGKSQFAIALLSVSSFDKIPWVIFDYKGEDLLLEIIAENPHAIKLINPTDKVPTVAGIYYMRPRYKLDDDDIEIFLMSCLDNGHTGIFVDEGFAFPQKAAFDLILTQGRSKSVPVISLYQRPVNMTRCAINQASYFALFNLEDDREKKTVNNFIKGVTLSDGQVINSYSVLTQYHCIWYDVHQHKTVILSPAPDKETILQTFRTRLFVEQDEIDDTNKSTKVRFLT
jgi:hypothetical protein